MNSLQRKRESKVERLARQWRSRSIRRRAYYLRERLEIMAWRREDARK